MSTYQQRCESQIRAWAQGFATHNEVDDECCPDFSCCCPDLFTQDEKERRERLHLFLERQEAGCPS